MSTFFFLFPECNVMEETSLNASLKLIMTAESMIHSQTTACFLYVNRTRISVRMVEDYSPINKWTCDQIFRLCSRNAATEGPSVPHSSGFLLAGLELKLYENFHYKLLVSRFNKSVIKMCSKLKLGKAI